MTTMIAAEDDGIADAAATVRAMGVRVEPVQVDLASRDGVDELVERIERFGQPIDALALNAGVGVGGAFLDGDPEREQNIIDLNVTSTVRLSHLLIPDMVERGEGRVLYTSSIAGEMPALSKPYTALPRHSFKNKVQSTLAEIMPETTTAELHRKQAEPGSAE